MAISIQDGLINLWNSTGIVNFVLPADPSIQNSVEQFLHMYGQILMVFICLFLLWLGIPSCAYRIRRFDSKLPLRPQFSTIRL